MLIIVNTCIVLTCARNSSKHAQISTYLALTWNMCYHYPHSRLRDKLLMVTQSWEDLRSECRKLLECAVFHLSCASCFSPAWLCETPWTVGHQAPLCMGFPKQEYWSGLPCPSPGDLPDPGIKPSSLTSPAFAGRFFTSSTTWEAQECATNLNTVCLPFYRIAKHCCHCHQLLISDIYWTSSQRPPKIRYVFSLQDSTLCRRLGKEITVSFVIKTGASGRTLKVAHNPALRDRVSSSTKEECDNPFLRELMRGFSD